MAVAALVLGIVSIVFAVMGLGLPLGFICGVVGIVMGIMGKKDIRNAGMAKAGFICSIVGTVLSVFAFVACSACVGTFGLAGSLL
ncbi:MAG: DUF4190 domain-containing protein [Eubacteriales bacterium]|nr:DUF4190 domain-containing protein [Eubacteriales bacterium]